MILPGLGKTSVVLFVVSIRPHTLDVSGRFVTIFSLHARSGAASGWTARSWAWTTPPAPSCPSGSAATSASSTTPATTRRASGSSTASASRSWTWRVGRGGVGSRAHAQGAAACAAVLRPALAGAAGTGAARLPSCSAARPSGVPAQPPAGGRGRAAAALTRRPRPLLLLPAAADRKRMKAPAEAEVQEGLAHMAGGPVDRTKVKAADVRFKPLKGWFGGDMTERVEGWSTKVGQRRCPLLLPQTAAASGLARPPASVVGPRGAAACSSCCCWRLLQAGELCRQAAACRCSTCSRRCRCTRPAGGW
jgi:hypothetical protein